MSKALGMWDLCSGKMQAPRGAEERGDRLCVLQVAKLKGEGLPKSSRAR